MGTAVRREAEKLRARMEEIAHALLCVGPVDLSITSKTQSLGFGCPASDVVVAMERWLSKELALYAAQEGLAVLAKPEFALDHDGRGRYTLTALAPTLRWDALRWPEEKGCQG